MTQKQELLPQMQHLAERRRNAACCAFDIAQNMDWLLSSTKTTCKTSHRNFADLGASPRSCRVESP